MVLILAAPETDSQPPPKWPTWRPLNLRGTSRLGRAWVAASLTEIAVEHPSWMEARAIWSDVQTTIQKKNSMGEFPRRAACNVSHVLDKASDFLARILVHHDDRLLYGIVDTTFFGPYFAEELKRINPAPRKWLRTEKFYHPKGRLLSREKI